MTTETAFLKARTRLSRGPLTWAGASSLANALLLIVQYRLLASVVSDVLFAGQGLDSVWPRLWPILIVVVARALAVWAGEAAAVTAAARVKQSLRMDLLGHLMTLGPIHLKGERTGELTTMLVEGVDALDPYYARFLPAMSTVALVPLAVLAAVLPMDWLSALVLTVSAPLIPLFMILIGKGAERLNQRQWAKLARMSAHFLEALQGLTTLKLFNASRRESEVIARISEDYRLATMAVLRVAFLSALALEFFATLGVALVAVFIGFRLLSGNMGFEQGFFVLLLAPEFYLPLRSLGAHYHARMEAIGAASRIAEIMQQPATTTPAAEATTTDRRAIPKIVFRDVHLTYEGGRKGLNGADFQIEPGEMTALVGPSGAGKSSIVNVLLGFVAPTTGTILVDGQPLASLNIESWRQRIAWVPQSPHLFRGSIADNIRLGTPDALDDAMENSARLTGADDFIRTLPGGYRHEIAEGGRDLSGGQRRLIALTRAALRDAALLILDEPTASLDRDSERKVSEAVRRLSQGRSLLVVAHRLETVRAADRILVLDGGRIIEQGRHDALLALGGLYAELIATGSAFALPEMAS
jgi:ATP-binding cassette subfamily C protein CydD